MKYKKLTIGYVIQVYDTDKPGFVSQEFVAGEVEWEDIIGNPISSDDVPDEALNTYLDFNMEQPE
jgi:hypothetical protein